MDFQQKITGLLTKNANLSREEASLLLTIPPDPRLGDYAFPCFKLGKNPKEEAEMLKKKIRLPKFLQKIEAVGPYLNFFLHPTFLAKNTLSRIYQEKRHYGSQNIGKNKKAVIDFSSPNIAKPFGIGHLRSTVIGNSLYKIFNFLNYRPIGVNHLGDWGTQFGKLIVAFKKWGQPKQLKNEPIKYLLKLYVKFHKEAEKNPELEEQARDEFKKLECGEKGSLALWETFRELSLLEFNKIYHLLNVKFDTFHGEAFYRHLSDKTIKDVQKRVKTEISEGALIVNLEKYGLPPLMLRKSDGTTTYAARDLAAAFYRLKQYRPEKIVYVVGSEQNLHFQQFFRVLELFDKKNKPKFVHVNFGLFQFPEGKISTRKGNIIFLEEVLNKAINLAQKIIEEKNPGLKNKKEVAQAVGVGAIIFADLSTDRIRDVLFDWKKFLSFEGETAPYLQYTHARACSILRKAKQELGLDVSPKVDFEMLNQAEGLAVIKSLYQFSDTVIKAAQTYKPHHLTGYLITLAQAFNEFYHKCPVISDQKHIMKARLLLVDSVRQALENGLGLLGIKAPEEM